MNEIEKTFIETFVREARCRRSLSLLSSSKNRHKFRNLLAHEFDADLINCFAHDKDDVPSEIAAQIQKEVDKWKKTNPGQLCYIAFDRVKAALAPIVIPRGAVRPKESRVAAARDSSGRTAPLGIRSFGVRTRRNLAFGSA